MIYNTEWAITWGDLVSLIAICWREPLGDPTLSVCLKAVTEACYLDPLGRVEQPRVQLLRHSPFYNILRMFIDSWLIVCASHPESRELVVDVFSHQGQVQQVKGGLLWGSYPTDIQHIRTYLILQIYSTLHIEPTLSTDIQHITHRTYLILRIYNTLFMEPTLSSR